MSSEKISDNRAFETPGRQPVRDRDHSDFDAYSRCFREDEVSFGGGRRPRSPATLVRFPDYGQTEAHRQAPAAVNEEPFRRRRGFFFRLLGWTAGISAVWLFGLAAGVGGAHYFHLEKGEKAPLAETDGEYTVEEAAPEKAFAAGEVSVPAERTPQVFAADEKGPAKASEAGMAGEPVEVLDTIASIPPWNPDGGLPVYTSDAPAAENSPAKPLETAKAFRPADPVSVPEMPRGENSGNTFTAARSQPLAAAEPAGLTQSEADPVPPVSPAAERIAENSAKPMKNQIEYFEPFETVSFSSESNPAVRVTASEGFYDDAYGVDNFSDYVPPRRSESEIPGAEDGAWDK